MEKKIINSETKLSVGGEAVENSMSDSSEAWKNSVTKWRKSRGGCLVKN